METEIILSIKNATKVLLSQPHGDNLYTFGIIVIADSEFICHQ
jgi:hypothetical protein